MKNLDIIHKTEVSIIVPVYNVEKYLIRCVNSLQDQTLKNIEIILVDDASSDNSPALCEQLAERDSRIKVIHKQRNEGLGMACNTGIENANGRYVAFCDSDDWVEEDGYAKMYATAQSYNADAVYTGIQRVNQNEIVTPMSQADRLKVHSGRKAIQDLMMDMIASEPSDKAERHIQMSAKIVLYSAKIIKENKLKFVSEREFISEDLLFNLDFLSKSEKVCQLPYTFYNYFVNETSLTNNVKTNRMDGYEKLYKELNLRYSDFSCSQEWRVRTDRMIIGYVRHDLLTYLRQRITYKEKKEFFYRIVNNHLWRKIWGEYPLFKMPAKHLIFGLSQKYKWFHLALFISKL